MSEENCSCGRIYVGNDDTGALNLNLDCKEHGRESEWYNSPAQVEYRLMRNERTKEMWRLAAEARKRVQDA